MNNDVVYLDVARHMAERNELTRIAAQRCIDRAANGEAVDPLTLTWARQFVRNVKPLGRPLSSGTPRELVPA